MIRVLPTGPDEGQTALRWGDSFKGHIGFGKNGWLRRGFFAATSNECAWRLFGISPIAGRISPVMSLDGRAARDL